MAFLTYSSQDEVTLSALSSSSSAQKASGCAHHEESCNKAAFSLVQLRSLRHASTQEDGQTIRRKHAPAAGKRQIHTRISRSERGRHALPGVYPSRTHFAHASPLAYCCPYACVVAQVETQPKMKLHAAEIIGTWSYVSCWMAKLSSTSA
jgi:hypothetical protein